MVEATGNPVRVHENPSNGVDRYSEITTLSVAHASRIARKLNSRPMGSIWMGVGMKKGCRREDPVVDPSRHTINPWIACNMSTVYSVSRIILTNGAKLSL